MSVLQMKTRGGGVHGRRRNGGIYGGRKRNHTEYNERNGRSVCVKKQEMKNVEGKQQGKNGKMNVEAGGRRSLVVARSSSSRSDATEASLAEAQKRWDASVRNGRFMSVTSAEIKSMLNDGWVLLDVRRQKDTSTTRFTRVRMCARYPVRILSYLVAVHPCLRRMLTCVVSPCVSIYVYICCRFVPRKRFVSREFQAR